MPPTMSYDERLAARVREAVGARRGVSEREMFGGVAFLLAGKMFVGVIGPDLVVRVGPGGNDDALAKPHVRPMDFTGRPMRGYVYVAPPGTKSAAAIRPWVDQAARFVATLPPKKKKSGRGR